MTSKQYPLAEKKAKPGRQYIPLEVTRLASGADLHLGLHVLTGHKDGPTLGILTTIHGDETFPLMAVRELLNSIDTKGLSVGLPPSPSLIRWPSPSLIGRHPSNTVRPTFMRFFQALHRETSRRS